MTRAHLASLAVALFGAVVGACGAESASSTGGGSSVTQENGGAGGANRGGGDSAAGGGGQSASGGGGSGGCVLESLPLYVAHDGGQVLNMHAKIRYQDADAALLVDTGSQLTFLQEPLGSPDPVEDAATFQLGCLDLDVIGRPTVQLPPIEGVPTVGFLGVDFLTSGPTRFDFGGERILFHAPGAPFAEAASWPSAAFEIVDGSVLVHVTLDGTAVHMIVDTGASDTTWVGVDGQPGDTEIMMQDAYGDVFPGYQGTAVIDLGGKTKTVPVTRVPMFPNYQPPAPDVVGLVGISSLGRGFVFDTDASTVRADF